MIDKNIKVYKLYCPVCAFIVHQVDESESDSEHARFRKGLAKDKW